MASVLSASHFHNEEAAYEYVEARLWPNGPVCPHCGASGDRVGRLEGKSTRPGLRKCYACRKPFTVKMGTIFEASHVKLNIWLQAIHLICSSKKGISTRQLQRTLGVGMKTAWFLGHRIRMAMEPGEAPEPLGGRGKVVEADEMFIGHSPKTKKGPGYQHKMKVLSLVERGGSIRSFPLNTLTAYEIQGHIDEQVKPGSRLHTDGARWYKFPRGVKHESVDHNKKEYVRSDVHVNLLEGYFSVFKRGMFGTYQRVAEKHLHRYTAEFDFRYNTRERVGVNDVRRTELAVQGAKGKRLTYRTTSGRDSEMEIPF